MDQNLGFELSVTMVCSIAATTGIFAEITANLITEILSPSPRRK